MVPGSRAWFMDGKTVVDQGQGLYWILKTSWVHDAGGLSISKESFVGPMMRVTSRKRSATRRR